MCPFSVTHVTCASVKSWHTHAQSCGFFFSFFAILFIETENLSSLQQLPWRQGLNPKPSGFIHCMSVCSLPFTATSRKTARWVDGWLRLLWMVVMVHSNHLRFPAAFHTRTVPLKHVKFSLVYRLLCSILFFWHISGYGSYHKVYHWWPSNGSHFAVI